MNALLAAEQALLGAVLLDPDQLACLDWLAPEHFYRPAHGALFAALRKLRVDGYSAAAVSEVPLSWVNDAVEEAGRHVRGLDAKYAHTLVAACPRPGHAPLYGRMVLEGAIHRTVTEHAIRLHQAARADAVQGDVEGALHYANVLAGVLVDLAHRWGSDPRPIAPAAPPAVIPSGPPAHSDRTSQDEQFLLALLVERPGAMTGVAGWLRPGDFADPVHGQLYRCLGALHHRGEPVDRITVLWEAQHRGLLADGTLTAERIEAICVGLGPGSAEWLGERILGASVTRTAASSARVIRALAEDGALAPGRLISSALHALGPLDDVRARWQAANREPAPATPLAASASAPSPTTRVHAALSRSTPHQSAQPHQRPSPTAALPPRHPRAHG